jgi:tetratricopeptide (TPR) repeat protein
MPGVVIAAGVAAYLGSFKGVFLFDDLRRIVENPSIRRFASVWSSLPGDERPLVSLSLALNYAISGLNVWSYHLFNLAIHLLAALTLFGVVAGTLRTPRFNGTAQDAARGFAFVVALLWVLHPLQTASVTYVIQRAESMMGLFYLLTFYCVIRGAAAKRPGPWYLAAVIACALGMGSKAIMITAPVLVLLYDRVFLSASLAEVFRRRWALHAGLFATLAVLAATSVAGLIVNPDSAQRQDLTVGLGYQGSTPLEYALTQPGVILHYLRLSLWPDALCLDYAWPLAKTAGAIVIPLLLVGALLAGTIALFWRWPQLGFAGVWFFVVLAPASSVVPVADVAFEHRMYLPLAAVIVFVVAAFQWFLRLAAESLHLPPATRRTVLVASVVLVAGACGAVTIRRQQDYLSSYTMWANVLKQRSANPRAYNEFGVELATQGRLDEAIAHYREAIRLKDDYSTPHNNLGIALAAQGKLEEAIAHYRVAIRLKHNYVEAHNNLGLALAAQGKLEEAIFQYREAIRLKDDYGETHNNLGLALAAQGKLEEAIAHYREAIRLKDDYVEAHNNLGLALAAQGKLEEAIAHYREAIRLKDVYGETQNNLGLALAAQGKLEEAIVHYREAIRLKDNYLEAHTNLGNALARTGRQTEAIQQLRRALNLDPQNALAKRNLTLLLQNSGRLDEATAQSISMGRLKARYPVP